MGWEKDSSWKVKERKILLVHFRWRVDAPTEGEKLRRTMRTLRTVFCWNRPLQGANVGLVPNCSMMILVFEGIFIQKTIFTAILTLSPCLDICFGFGQISGETDKWSWSIEQIAKRSKSKELNSNFIPPVPQMPTCQNPNLDNPQTITYTKLIGSWFHPPREKNDQSGCDRRERTVRSLISQPLGSATRNVQKWVNFLNRFTYMHTELKKSSRIGCCSVEWETIKMRERFAWWVTSESRKATAIIEPRVECLTYSKHIQPGRSWAGYHTSFESWSTLTLKKLKPFDFHARSCWTIPPYWSVWSVPPIFMEMCAKRTWIKYCGH